MWRRIFQRKKKRKAEPPPPEPDELVTRHLGQLRDRLKSFLVTRYQDDPLMKKGKSFQLVRSNPGLFKLEAEGISILINTEPFLVRTAEGRVQGLLQMSEVALCRAIQGGKDAADFIAASEPPAREQSYELYMQLSAKTQKDEPERLPAPSEILGWENFDLDQVIARSDTNTLAHVLIHADQKLEETLRGRFSRRMKSMIADELQSLGSAGSNPLLNPQTKRRSLLEFEPALRDFRQTIQDYKRAIETKKERERRKLSLPS